MTSRTGVSSSDGSEADGRATSRLAGATPTTAASSSDVRNLGMYTLGHVTGWRGRTKREQLRHSVASVVRELILSRKVRPGEILRLGRIANEMDISVTPVREALLLLAQDGWLAQEPNRGFLVLPTRRSDFEDIYYMWGEAEGEQAYRAANKATNEDIAKLRKIDARLRAGEGKTAEQANELNNQLHGMIHRIADAPKLLWFTDASRRLLPFEFWLEMSAMPKWQEVNSTDHTRVVDAIERRNPADAAEQMKDHFVITSRLLLEWLDSISFWDF